MLILRMWLILSLITSKILWVF